MNTSIEQKITEWAQAVGSHQLEQIMAFYAEDLIAYDAVDQLEFKGKAIYQAHWQKCLALCSSEAAWFKLHQPEIRQNEELAFCYSLVHCGGTDEKGKVQGCWMRLTQGWQKQQGQWRIIHDHFSVPFDMESCAGLFELTPQA
jgi:ketosteroid isomerase-like protein